MDIFYEIHKDIPREGPGDNDSTKQAITMLKDIPENSTILDIGCGPGMQTIELAKNINGKVFAIDINKTFLDRLVETSFNNNLSRKIEAKQMSMFSLEFKQDNFDVIWCEGAIFIIGFERGIQEWRNYIKIGGYLVVSEISWLRKDIPEEPKSFWESDYPEIKGIADNIKIIETSGYSPVGHFVIPESGWWKDYYNPLIDRINKLRKKYINNKEANNRLDNTQREIEMYEKYSDYYGYVFYIMKRID
ncbi:class I SAM-dependent methyltransferase [Senegalia massiliensis]|uniref:Class I SAM-dependent methyltransferase n=1 Tax=Senegalia massiliensis TaxID=1720316 RepID=A0A845QYE9_9CLOT|nr:class I SAM-dependent methyltransferase [Senegalia massiliensis]NBI05413.1 class I SAM-dependent methyltransferase [Senegalia massiliensis]